MSRPIIARQPVLDRNKSVVAFELIYRDKKYREDSFKDMKFTAGQINEDMRFAEESNLLDGKKIFLNFDMKFLKSEISDLIFKEQLGIEISNAINLDSTILDSLNKLKNEGSLIIINLTDFKNINEKLFSQADLIKINFERLRKDDHKSLINNLKMGYQNLKFFAENIDKHENFKAAKETGYDYFQGDFFTKPDIIPEREVPGYKLNYLKLLKELNKKDLDFDNLENIIKNDMSMTVSLLSMINSAYYGYKVSSIKQASALLGVKGLKKWSLIYLVDGLQNDKPDILFVNALTRAKFAEALAEDFGIKKKSGDLFTMGIFSMMDAFMDRHLSEVLKKVPLTDQVKNALLQNKGLFGEILMLVKAFEKADWSKISNITKNYSLKEEKLYSKYLKSVDFAYETMNDLMSEANL